MHYTQKLLAGLAVSALSAGGFTGLEAAFQGAAAAQTVSNTPDVRSATNPQGHTFNLWSSSQSGANHAPDPKSKCKGNQPFCQLEKTFTVPSLNIQDAVDAVGRAGKDIQDAMGKTGKDIQDAAGKIQDAAEESRKNIQDAMGKVLPPKKPDKVFPSPNMRNKDSIAPDKGSGG